MQLKKETIKELGEILKQEYSINLPSDELEKLANSLVGYFSLLLKAKTREKIKLSSEIVRSAILTM